MIQFQHDEMQKQQQNRIGSQSFILLVILLLLNIFVYYLGFRWLDFPIATMVIVLVCCGIYKIRVVLCGAFVAPGAKVATTWMIIAGIAVSAVAVALAAVFYFGKDAAHAPAEDHSALVLLLVSAGLLLVSVVVSWVMKRRDNSKDD